MRAWASISIDSKHHVPAVFLFHIITFSLPILPGSARHVSSSATAACDHQRLPRRRRRRGRHKVSRLVTIECARPSLRVRGSQSDRIQFDRNFDAAEKEALTGA